jgi:hypothetical protein
MDEALKASLLKELTEAERRTVVVVPRSSERELRLLLSNQLVILKVFKALLES